MENVFVDLKQVLYAPDEPIEHVYFPKNSIDRQGLEECSCEYYGIVKREFERLIGDN